MDNITLRTSNNEPITFEKFGLFTDGAINVRLAQTDIVPSEIIIDANLRTASGILELLMITDAVRRKYPGYRRWHLLCKYLPYARQDRVCNEGEAFSLEVLCNLINAQHYDSVTVWDVHSKVSMDLLQNATNVHVSDLISAETIGNKVLVSPDKGAFDRVYACSKKFDRLMIIAEKIRNPDTMAITGTKIVDSYMDRINQGLINVSNGFIIIDDICDGGRTFIELAKVLRPLTTGTIDLWVTHMIASYGFDVFNGLVDNIYTANCFRNDVPDFVHVTG